MDKLKLVLAEYLEGERSTVGFFFSGGETGYLTTDAKFPRPGHEYVYLGKFPIEGPIADPEVVAAARQFFHDANAGTFKAGHIIYPLT